MNDSLQRALGRLILRYPFIAAVGLRLQRIDDPLCDTAWTNGVHLAVNPVWFDTLSEDERVAVAAHEILHVALAHHLRRRGREPQRWNVACDYAVNKLLADEGFDLSSNGWLFEPAYGDAPAEQIYDLLPTEDMAPTFLDVRDLPLPAPPTSPIVQDLLAQHAMVITSLAQQVRACGTTSAAAERAKAEALRPGAVDWRGVLSEFLASRQAQDYTWIRPNQRYVHLGLFLPSFEAAAPGHIAFVLDTSGSIPDEALQEVTAELEHFLSLYPLTTLTVLYADTHVTGRSSYTAADLPLRLTPLGGGGTDFRPALAELEADDPPPNAIIYLTDLCGFFPIYPPSSPVIWLVYHAYRKLTAPFGKVVELPF
jgi:predicted metal-dependent peptidase